MKNLLKFLPVFILSLGLFTACGSKNNPTCAAGQVYDGLNCVSTQGVNQGVQTGYTNSCPANQINTQLGCLGQGGPCTQGMGWDPKYNNCYPPMAGGAGYANGAYNNGGYPTGAYNNGGYNNGNYNGATAGWGANVGLPPSGNPSYNQCANGYAPTQQGCVPRCAYNYNGGMCVNY